MLKNVSFLSLVLLLGGCAVFSPEHSSKFSGDGLKLLAYDLGTTHAGLARCGLDTVQLSAHLESAQIALKAQAGSRISELSPIFEQGLQESAGIGRRLHIPCDCALELVNESRAHNLTLYRTVVLPKAFESGTAQPYSIPFFNK